MENLEKLINMSQKFGQNPDYIIAGGGNSSFKDDEKMWVKASGTSMANIAEDGFVCLDRNKMKVISEKQYSANSSEREQEVKQDLQNSILFPEGKRPSVEASMHEIINWAFVMHTHPTLVNGVLCAKNSKEVIAELFGDEVVYVPYTDPGYVLFKDVMIALNKFKAEKSMEPHIIFLENHGVFVGADNCDEIDAIYEEIQSKLMDRVENMPDASDRADEQFCKLAESVDLEGSTVVDSSPLSMAFVKNAESFKDVNVPFTPDNIVYCKSKYLLVKDLNGIKQKIADFKSGAGYEPKVIAVEGRGLITLEENQKSSQIVMDVFKDMMKVSYYTRFFGGPRPMSSSQIEFIDNWEVENYRRKVSKAGN